MSDDRSLAQRETSDNGTIRSDDPVVPQDAVVDTPALTFHLNTPDALLTGALAKAQGAFPVIEKKHTGDAGSYKYTYADLADVLAAVRPVLAENGLALVQQTEHAGGKVLLTTTLRHVGGGEIASSIEIAQSPGNAQQFGGALTYMRRYEIVTLLGVAAEDDNDAQHVTPVGRQEPQAAPLPAWAKPSSRGDLAAANGALAGLGGTEAAKRAYRAVVALFHPEPIPVGVAHALLAAATALPDPEAEVDQAPEPEAEADAALADELPPVEPPAADVDPWVEPTPADQQIASDVRDRAEAAFAKRYGGAVVDEAIEVTLKFAGGDVDAAKSLLETAAHRSVPVEEYQGMLAGAESVDQALSELDAWMGA